MAALRRTTHAHASAGGGDAELVRNVLAREPRAVERFLERMRCVPRMLMARNVQLGTPLSESELEDVVQDTLIALWRKLSRYDGSAALETWAYRFCFFEFLKHLRRLRRGPDLLAEIPADARTTPGPDLSWSDHERVRDGLERLEPAEAQVVRMKHFDGLTFEELARRLDLPANTAKTRYYRGMRKLRAWFGGKTVEAPRPGGPA